MRQIPYDLIRKKQSGQAHTAEEVQYLVGAFTRGELPDYQMSAWLMAVYFQGMIPEERNELVNTMINSGRRLDFSHLDGYVADKHSTGGVGDKVSLVLGPLLAACGLYVPMLSGRGLGHTGGTLDKLEAIPGFRISLDLDAFQRQVAEVGICMMGQTSDICPADKKLYALRDVTSTVSSVPLIAGSIMSKKIAEGIRGLILDVKWGSGAFMTRLEDARALAKVLIETGQAFGVHTRARVTDMNQPLGATAGIWCEVQESVRALEGGGPADLLELTRVLASDILKMAGHSDPGKEIQGALDSGRAREKLDQMVAAQGGDVKALANARLHQPSVTIPLLAPADGYLATVDTYRAGMSLIEAKAGRTQQSDGIDPTAGFALDIKIGDRVSAGSDIGRYFGSNQSFVEAAAKDLMAALSWSGESVEALPLIVDC
ncbi:MAG: thymidine phosphorylase [Candidatus Marinimicrobia bacterium]|nr:thymidine phosphorylase [Candidatus Neomarinimicrobiota bacterium]